MAYQESALYCDSVAYTAVAQWQATHAYTVGNIVRQLAAPAVGNERCFVCIAAGTSLASEPAWGTPPKGQNYTETGGPKWMECTGLPALNSDGTSTNAWQTSGGSVVQGTIIKDVAAAHYFICTGSGIGGTGAEPSWNTTAGGATADGSVTWTCLGAVGSFTTKLAAPIPRLALLGSAGWLNNNGMTVYVGDDHAETSSANIAINPVASCSIICVDHTVSLPPGASNLKTTATITASSGGGLTYTLFQFGLNIYVYGVQFIHSAAGGSISIANTTGGRIKCEQCVFSYTSSNTTSFLLGYQNSSGGYLELAGCTFHFSQAAQYLALNGSQMLVKNCTMTGTSPTTGIKGNPTLGGGAAQFEGCDFSNWTGNLLGGPDLSANIVFKDCKLSTGATIVLTGDSTLSMSGCIDLNRCDSGGTNYRNERHHWSAAETTSTNVVRTGGAADGATPISHRIATTTNLTSANIMAVAFFPAIPMAIWNAVTGSNRNVTLYGIANDSRVPNNDEVWFDVEYLGSATSPRGSFASGTKNNILATGTALTADTSAWDSAATARANTTAYTVGQVIKTASNPGRVFFCTTAGTSAGSEPGVGSAVWNPNDLLNTTLSNNNLTATAPSAAGGVRANYSVSTGKYYWECTCNATQANEGVGIGIATASLTSGVTTAAIMITSGQIYVNGSNVAGGSGFTTGNVICIAVDLTNSLIWFRVGAAGNWNGSSSNNPATGVGGVSFSVLAKPLFPYLVMSGGNGTAYTANFGATSFIGTVPSGFSSGFASSGYSSATDGQMVFDGSATFRAGCRFSQTVALQNTPVPNTWNPSDLALITLSGGNLTCATSSSGSAGVRSLYGLSAGKFYFEILINATPGGGNLGLATSSASFTSIGNGSSGALVYITNGNLAVNGVGAGNLGSALSVGQTICFAVDLVNSQMWVRINGGNWNGSGTANPATNTGGFSIAALFPTNAAFATFAASFNHPCSMTANFGASSFAQAVPSGFSSWNSLMTISGQPQQPGYLYAYPKVGRASMTYYLDPLPVLS